MAHTDLPYKEDAIERGLDWIRDHFESMLSCADDNDEKLSRLKKEIRKIHLDMDYDSGDSGDACYNCIQRRIDEALDKPLSELCPLLMENVSTGPRRVTRRLYYPEAGKGK